MANQTAFAALGSNLGEPAAIIRRAAGRMDGILPGVRLAARSSIWHTAPHTLGALDRYPWPECLRPVEENPPSRTRDHIDPNHCRTDPLPAGPKIDTLTAGSWYANMVVRLDCGPSVSPEALFKALMALEAELGRNRLMESRYGPRFIDIDLLTFGDAVRRTQNLTLPHPRMGQRAFVLLPLRELADASPALDNPGGSSHASSGAIIF
jgi:2-amino-4-hydroxy-6-hydroxymethyldihydropteridine diphosphokinase